MCSVIRRAAMATGVMVVVLGTGAGVAVASTKQPAQFRAQAGTGVVPSHLYWSDTNDGTIHEANLDGTDPTTLATSQNCPSGVAADSSYLYWVSGSCITGTIMRANLDGTGAIPLITTGQNSVSGLAVDRSYIYWTNSGSGTIMRAKLDGSGTTTLVTGQLLPVGVAVDGSHLYWVGQTPMNGPAIMTANLDGSDPTILVAGQDDLFGVAVDGSHVYWANDDTGSNTGAIMKANLDGSSVTTLTTDVPGPVGVAVDSGHIYWTNFRSETVMKANLDGSGVTTLATGQPGALGLAVSVSAPVNYVALGDSFSSGEGNPPYLPGTNTGSPGSSGSGADQCHRSSQAYGPLIETDLSIPASDFTFAACSGAVMADFVANLPGADAQYGEGPQLNAIAPAGQTNPNTSLVTLSVGGNDAGFPFILRACISAVLQSRSAQADCLNSIQQHLTTGTRLLEQGGIILLSTKNNSYRFCDTSCASGTHSPNNQVVTVPSLAGLYEQVHQRAPNAEIRVLLYPHLFPASPPAQCVVGTLTVSGHTLLSADINATEMAALNAAADSLDAVISTAVTAAQGEGIDIQTVDARPVFAGHEICTTEPWFNAIVGSLLSPDPGSFHPNATGQRNLANLFEARI